MMAGNLLYEEIQETLPLPLECLSTPHVICTSTCTLTCGQNTSLCFPEGLASQA